MGSHNSKPLDFNPLDRLPFDILWLIIIYVIERDNDWYSIFLVCKTMRDVSYKNLNMLEIFSQTINLAFSVHHDKSGLKNLNGVYGLISLVNHPALYMIPVAKYYFILMDTDKSWIANGILQQILNFEKKSPLTIDDLDYCSCLAAKHGFTSLLYSCIMRLRNHINSTNVTNIVSLSFVNYWPANIALMTNKLDYMNQGDLKELLEKEKARDVILSEETIQWSDNNIHLNEISMRRRESVSLITLMLDLITRTNKKARIEVNTSKN